MIYINFYETLENGKIKAVRESSDQNLVLEMSQNSFRCIESDKNTSSMNVTSWILGF